MTEPVDARPPRIHPGFDRLAGYSWRLIVVGVVVVALLWLLREARVVFGPLVVAVFLARALSPVAGWLRRHRWRPGLAALASLLAFFVLAGALLGVAASSFASELDDLGPTLTAAVDDVQDYLADDSPITISRESFDRLRERAGEEFDALRSSSSGAVLDQATLAAELLAGAVLAVILTFFMIRDGERASRWFCGRARPGNQVRVRRSLDAAWSSLAGYLRGATLLGAIESVAIGLTMWIAGGGLIAPVMMVTFLGAYVPIVGAVGAGLVAVLIALVTGGTSAAIAVAIVALVVQQFDNDLLSPLIYGRSLGLHPVVVLLSVVAGGALFGIAGSVLAVPVVAVSVNGAKAYSAARLEPTSTLLEPA